MEKTSMQRVDNWRTRIKWRLPRASSLLLVSLFFSLGLNAQSTLPEWGPAIEIPKSENVIQLTLVEDSVPALITQFGEALIMRTFRAPQQEFPLFIRTEADMNLKSYLVQDDRVIVVEGARELESNELCLNVFHLTADKADKQFTHRFSLNQLPTSIEKSTPLLNASPSGSHIVVCQQEGFRKKSNAIFNLMVTDLSSSKVFHLPSEFDSDDVELLGCTVDDSGIVYLGVVAGVKLNSPFRKRYLIYSFDPKNKRLTEFDLSSHDLFLRDIVIQALGSGIYVAGLYNSDPLEEKESSGYIYVRLTQDGKEIGQRVVSAFQIGLIRVYEGLDATGEDAIAYVYISRVVRVGNKHAILLEKHFKDQVCMADPRTGMLNCTDQYHFDDLALLNIDDQRTMVTVEKRQIEYDRPSIFSGHTVGETPQGGALMFYNDHYKNTGLRAEKIMNNANRSVIRYVHVREDGTHSQGVLTKDRQADFIFTPKFGLPIDHRHAYLLSEHNRSFRVGKVTIDEL